MKEKRLTVDLNNFKQLLRLYNASLKKGKTRDDVVLYGKYELLMSYLYYMLEYMAFTSAEVRQYVDKKHITIRRIENAVRV